MIAVIYCRVSTEEESQRNALENQKQEAMDCVSQNGWDLVDAYIDEGKSGTSTKKRDEYKRLFEDLQTDKFDIVVIKSQDRLMRNTREWYRFIDTLVTHGKKLYFYLEHKFYTSEDAIITGIKAILAEEYSRELSKKIKNAHRHRQSQGTSILLTSATWGYDKKNKAVVVNESEAEIVRLIFDWCIQGHGSRTIGNRLTQQGIRSRNGSPFPEGTVRRIIRNPIYKGTVVMNKRAMDFETKKVLQNSEDCWVFHENALPPIVSSETWHKANEAMDARAKDCIATTTKKKRIGQHQGTSLLSGKLFCSECGAPFWRRQRKTKHNTIVLWSCANYVRYGRKKNIPAQGCNNIHVPEELLFDHLKPDVEESFPFSKSQLQQHLVTILFPIFQNQGTEETHEKINIEKHKLLYQKELLLEKLLENIISDADYKITEGILSKKLQGLQAKEAFLLSRCPTTESISTRLDNIQTFVEKTLYDQVLLYHFFQQVQHCYISPKEVHISLSHENLYLPWE